MKKRALAVVVGFGVAVVMGGCASSGGGKASGPAAAVSEEEGIVHQVSAADLEGVKSTRPLETERAVLWVNGLGCPQCATNVDLQLDRAKGITAHETDLGTGKISVTLGQPPRPSPAQLAKVISNAGFTLVKVEEVR